MKYSEKLNRIHKEASPAALKRMQGLINQSDLHNLMRARDNIRKDLKNEGFDDSDIDYYLTFIVQRGK